MSISSQSNRVQYAGDGGTTSFGYSFPIGTSDGSDIQVWICDDDGVLTLLASNYSVNTVTARVNYPTVGGVSPLDPGVNVLPATWNIILLRIEPLTQNLALGNQGAFDAASINSELDKLTMICQQMQEQLNRAPKYPINTVPTITQLDPTTLTFTVAPIIVSGSYANLKATAAASPTAPFFGLATDIGNFGQFVVYTGNTLIGDQGFILLGGG